MKFNTNTTTTAVQNYEGAKVFVMNPAMELYTAIVTWSLGDSFYEKNNKRMARVQELVAQNDPLFVAKLAVYARHKMYMRSAPLVLVTELAKLHPGGDIVARVTDRIIARADEITELLACYEILNGRTGPKKLNRLSKQIQKGLGAAFNRFDEYQFAKYNRPGAIKLRDALFLVHPKAKDDARQALFDKIANNTLQTPYTWETELSALGQVEYVNDEERAIAFRNKWEELIDSGKLGYMALLRNLRNVVEAGVSYAHIKKIGAILAAPEQVAKAKQFPFRYLAAYRELLQMDQPAADGVVGKVTRFFTSSKGYTGELLDVLEQAVQCSAANIAGFDHDTKVLLACDVSGSMTGTISAKSKIRLYDIGLILAMLLKSRCGYVEVGIFGDTWKTITVPRSNILGSVQQLYNRANEVGYATNAYLVLADLLANHVVMDKVMIFTDCQVWNSNATGESLPSLWDRYKRTVAPNAKLYIFDLAGHGYAPLTLLQRDVHLLAGWSDKIFDVLAALDKGADALAEINSLEL
ncbi:MAG: TROVE domain-containing protein [Flavipsychrobacter sp.]|nr:TROVE domain-containing protein [Flavipsychrobacter sp.]